MFERPLNSDDFEVSYKNNKNLINISEIKKDLDNQLGEAFYNKKEKAKKEEQVVENLSNIITEKKTLYSIRPNSKQTNININAHSNNNKNAEKKCKSIKEKINSFKEEPKEIISSFSSNSIINKKKDTDKKYEPVDKEKVGHNNQQERIKNATLTKLFSIGDEKINSILKETFINFIVISNDNMAVSNQPSKTQLLIGLSNRKEINNEKSKVKKDSNNILSLSEDKEKELHESLINIQQPDYFISKIKSGEFNFLNKNLSSQLMPNVVLNENEIALSIINKINNPKVQKLFLQRKVCSSLFKILFKLSKGTFSTEEVKLIVLEIEGQARTTDPEMGDYYKSMIKKVFNSVKIELEKEAKVD